MQLNELYDSNEPLGQMQFAPILLPAQLRQVEGVPELHVLHYGEQLFSQTPTFIEVDTNYVY